MVDGELVGGVSVEPPDESLLVIVKGVERETWSALRNVV